MFDDNYTVCPLRANGNGVCLGEKCEWQSDDGICALHHMIVALEAIADNMSKIVSGPAWEDDAI